MKKSILTLMVIIALISIMIIGCTSESTPAPTQPSESTPSPAVAPETKVIELRFADHNPPTGRITTSFLVPWTQEVEKATNGRVKITMYSGETLAKGTEAVSAVTGGITDISWLVHGFFPGRFPLSSVMQLPFIGSSDAEVNGKMMASAAVNSLIFQELYETVPEVKAEFDGMKVLYQHTSMPYFLSTIKKPVKNMADLKGMKIRELGGPPTEMWKLLGANPMLLNSTEIYEAAEKGVIDGAGLQWSIIGTFRFYEVFKYWTDVATTLSPYTVVMNQEKWDSLPPDVQQAIMKVSGKWGAEYAGNAAYGFDLKKSVEDAMSKNGYSMEKVNLDAGELANWRKVAGQPLWDSWVKDMNEKGLDGQKVLGEAQKLVEKYNK